MRIGVISFPLLLDTITNALPAEHSVAALAVPASYIQKRSQLDALAKRYCVPQAIALTRADLALQLARWIVDNELEMVLVVTFTYKIPPEILALPPRGFINVHFGRLPDYRGPDPYFWHVCNRDTYAEISFHQMNEEYDDGPVLLSWPVPIKPFDTRGMLYGRAVLALQEAIPRAFQRLTEPNPFTPQEASKARFVPRPSPQDLTIDWQKPPYQIEALVRASNPFYGGAIGYLRNTRLLIVECRFFGHSDETMAAGTIIDLADDGEGFFVKGSAGWALEITVVALADGTFSGRRFRALFGLKAGERFRAPPD